MRRQASLDDDERASLNGSVEQIRDVPSRHTMIRAGQPVLHSSLLMDGFVCRYMDDRAGVRQLVAIHVPGDFVDLHGYPLPALDHDVATIGPSRVAMWSRDALTRITESRPHLTRMLWYATLLDAAMHRAWTFRIGRLSAEGRVAHLMCELYCRLTAVGLTRNGAFDLPLKQTDLAEACGLTNVHVNRVLRAIRERGIMTFQHGTVTIQDRHALRTLADFDPGYLYLEADLMA